MDRFAVTAILLGLLVGCGTRSESDPVRILEAANTATQNVSSVLYQAELSLTGNSPSVPRDLHGTVTAERAATNGPGSASPGSSEAGPRQRIDARFTSLRSGSEVHMLVASDGRIATVIDYSGERFRRGEPSVMGQWMWRVQALYVPEFVASEPFREELKGRSLSYEGVEKVGDVECDVVRVEYDLKDARPTRWYFGRKDSLPRRVDRILADGEVYSVAITRLEPDPAIDEETFRPSPPEGFEDRTPSKQR